MEVEDYLGNNDSYSFFSSLNPTHEEQRAGLVMTGPTGTNVADVTLVIVTPSELHSTCSKL